jgi:hypothetical protein
LKLVRYQDWRNRLDSEIDKRKNRKFSYGRHDCCCAASACVKAMTGEDVLKEIFPKYIGKRKAKEVLEEYGGVEGVAEKFAKKYEVKEISVKRAQAGDLVLHTIDEGIYALGIVERSARTFAVPEKVQGWAHIPITKAKRAWRI